MPPLSREMIDQDTSCSTAATETSSQLFPLSPVKSSRHRRCHRRTTSPVMARAKRQFKQAVRQSMFLQQPPPQNKTDHLAYFERREIQTGQLLGTGGFCQVYEITGFCLDANVSCAVSSRNQARRQHFRDHAVDPVTQQGRYVLKHLKRERMNDDATNKSDNNHHSVDDFVSAVTDLLVEASLLLRLDHPNILKLHGLPAAWWAAYEDGDDGFFLILDRLSCTLEERIDEWSQQAQESHDTSSTTASSTAPEQNDSTELHKIQYSLQLAQALEYLHSHRLVYRDLKPNNVGFSSVAHDGGDDQHQERLVLFDLGLCRELPAGPGDPRVPGTYEMSTVGTQRYQAPEVLWEGLYNCKADVYGWSLVVWEMFALVRPYSGYDMREHTKYVIQGHERPALVEAAASSSHSNSKKAHLKKTRHEAPKGAIPSSLRPLLHKGWKANVTERSDMKSLQQELQGVLTKATASTSPRKRFTFSRKLFGWKNSSLPLAGQ